MHIKSYYPLKSYTKSSYPHTDIPIPHSKIQNDLWSFLKYYLIVKYNQVWKVLFLFVVLIAI